MKCLDLVLKQKYFEMTGEGGKMFELRKPSPWLLSRLFYPNGDLKQYTHVVLRAGYRPDGARKIKKLVNWMFLENDQQFLLPNGEYLQGLRNDVFFELANCD